MDYSPLSDNELMHAFYGCEEAAFDQITLRYWRPLWLFFYRLGWREGQDREELIQDTFVAILVTKDATNDLTHGGRIYDWKRPFKPWLYSIARNASTDKYRRRAHRPRTVPITDQMAHQRLDQSAGAGLDETAELGLDLHRCLERLTEQERTFIVLWEKGLGELIQTEIAEVLGVSNARVNAIKRGALRKLRECLEREGYGQT